LSYNHCPDPLCILDLTDPSICQHCPKKPKPHKNCPPDCEYFPQCLDDPQAADYCPRPHNGWGGRRDGAGAPHGNLNAIKHGRQSKLIQTAVNKLAADPELRAFLLLIARAATTGEIPETTKKLIFKALPSPKMEAASRRLKKLREVQYA